MRTNIVILSTMLISVVGFSQKSEIRTAERALKSGDAEAAKTALEGASSLIGSADERMQAQYYLLKGQAYSELAKKGTAGAFDEAIASLKKVGEIEAKSGKLRHTAESKEKLSAMTVDLVNAAVEDNNNKRFKEGAEK